ncbi:MAG: TraR/DksA C4-type zinc finger protein [Gammaproteobacteria bacterium]|nr:TraR/DksA C4-type zinc finger protein [Gammaproteobacteria bacterium]
MDPNEKSEIEEILIKQIELLSQHIQHLADNSKPIAPDVAIGRLSRMEAIAEQGVNETTLNSAKIRLNLLIQALERIDHEDFGVCQSCENEIFFARLKLFPESHYCVACLEAKS